MDKVLSGMIVVNFAVFWFFLGVLLSSNVITLLNGKRRKENDFFESNDKKSIDDKKRKKKAGAVGRTVKLPAERWWIRWRLKRRQRAYGKSIKKTLSTSNLSTFTIMSKSKRLLSR